MHRFVAASLLLVAGASLAVGPPRPPDPRIGPLIEQLGSGDFRQREKASRALEELGAAALPALSRAALSKDLEVRRRAVRLLKLQQDRLLAAVIARDGYWEKSGDDHSLLVKLSGRHIGDADLVGLKWLDGLTRLYVRHTRATDQGLAHLKGQTALRRFSLFGSSVSDAGLAHLKGMVNLEYLDLDDTRVGDAGLAHLKGLRELRRLHLSGTRVTDEGLAHLHGMEKLQRISLTNTKVTPQGLLDLQKALPWLVIERY